MAQKHLVVAFGGISPEHEVSVLTAMQVLSSLENSAYSLLPLYITKSGKWLTGEVLLNLESFKDLNQLEQDALPCTFAKNQLGTTLLKDTSKPGLFAKNQEWPVYAVVCAFHGGDGENGAFQGICEVFNVPYTGSGVLASSLGMDKVKAKQLCESNGIPIAPSLDFYEGDWEHHQKTILQEAELLGFPLVVKPCSLGSSIGVKKVDAKTELIEAVEVAFRYDAHVLIEKAIHPLMEINCSVLGTTETCRASVCEQPVGSDETLSFEDKYQRGDRADKGMASLDRVIPADISPELTENIRSMAMHTFKTFDAAGVARLDFLVNARTKEVYFNEINTIPGSFSFYLWDKSDLNFTQLVLELIDIALKRHQATNGRVRSYSTNLLSEKATKGLKGLKGTK